MLIRGLVALLGSLLASPVWAATPTHDATTNTLASVFNNQQNPSYTHTPSGSACPNSVAIIAVSHQDSTPGSLTSVTYGGAAVTSLGAEVATIAGWKLQMFIFKNSGTSAVTVQANFSEVMNATLIRTSTYCNVDQTTSTGTRATATGSGTAITVNVASAAGELVIDQAITGADAPVSLTVGASQTQRYNQTGFSDNHTQGGSEEAGGASVTMSWTAGASTAWGIIGIPLKPATAPAMPTALHVAGPASWTSTTFIWAPNTETDLTGYKVYSGTVSGQTNTLLATITAASAAASHSPMTRFMHRRPVAGTMYYTVAAYNATGDSAKSSEISVTVAGISARSPITIPRSPRLPNENGPEAPE